MSSDTIDVSFKISVIDEFRQHMLHIRRNCTGIKSQLTVKALNQMPGQNHVSDSQ